MLLCVTRLEVRQWLSYCTVRGVYFAVSSDASFMTALEVA